MGDAHRKRLARAQLATFRRPDPGNGGRWRSEHPDCPHGTAYGYETFSCECPPCTRAGSGASSLRRTLRKVADLPTVQIDLANLTQERIAPR